MNPYQQSARKTVYTVRDCKEVIQEFKNTMARESICEILTEIDNLRKAKSEILKGDSSPIVKGYLANEIENRIEMLKSEIDKNVEGY